MLSDYYCNYLYSLISWNGWETWIEKVVQMQIVFNEESRVFYIILVFMQNNTNKNTFNIYTTSVVGITGIFASLIALVAVPLFNIKI